MIRSVPARPVAEKRRGRPRTFFGVVGLGATMAMAVSLTAAIPANAGDVSTMPVYPCDHDTLYKLDSTKGLLGYGVGLNSHSVATSPKTASSSALWKGYAKVLGAPQGVFSENGFLYAIDSANSTTADRGLYLWKITGDSVKSPVKIDTSLAGTTFTKWSKSKNNLITTDTNGDIFTLTDGLLRRFVVDRKARTITRYQHLAGVEWKDYDLIVAGAEGQLFARTKAGQLYEYHLDPASERWIGSRKLVSGSGWQNFSTVVSPGDNRLLAVTTTGALKYYLRSGSSFSSWTLASSGWTGAVVATSLEACESRKLLPGTPVETPLEVPATRNSPLSVLRTADVPGSATSIRFALTTNVGQLFSLTVPDEASLDQLGTPVLASGSGDYYVGTPAYVGDPDRGASILGLRSDGHVGRGYAGTTSWAWADKLGLFPHPVTGVQVASRAMAVFGVDADGDLWVSESLWKANSAGTNVPGGSLGAWRKLARPGGGALTGEISVAPLANGSKAALVARASDGKLYTATYAAPTETGVTFSSWTALPAASTAGTPSLTVAQGDLLRIASRTTSGAVVTLGQTTSGFPSQWTQVAPSEVSTDANTYQLTGNPGVIYNPADGRVTVFSRTTNGSVLAWQETAQACNTFSAGWAVADAGTNTAALVADPVPFVFSRDNRYDWGFASYDADFKVTLFHRSDASTNSPATCSTSSTSGSMSALGTQSAPSSKSAFVPPAFTKSVAAPAT